MIPSWEWLRMHIDPARSRTVVRAAQVAAALERTAGLPADEADRRMRSLPGIGVWTSAEVRFRAHGDADAVSFGDYHIAKNVGWALTGQEVDDDGLAELLEPYRPHRYRVQRLVELRRAQSSPARPAHGPAPAPAGLSLTGPLGDSDVGVASPVEGEGQDGAGAHQGAEDRKQHGCLVPRFAADLTEAHVTGPSTVSVRGDGPSGC